MPTHHAAAGTSNFYAMTRYNGYSTYAMAVNELRPALRRAFTGAP